MLEEKGQKCQLLKARDGQLVQDDPTMLCSPAASGPGFQGQDGTQTPQLSGESAEELEDYTLKLGHLPTSKCFQYCENISL